MSDYGAFGTASLDLGALLDAVVGAKAEEEKKEKIAQLRADDELMKEAFPNRYEPPPPPPPPPEPAAPVVINVPAAAPQFIILPPPAPVEQPVQAPIMTAAAPPPAPAVPQDKVEDAISEREAVQKITIRRVKQGAAVATGLGLLWWALS